MDCPSCGTVATGPGQRFCTKCGTNLAPVEPPTAYGQGTRISGPLFADDVPQPPAAPPSGPPPSGPPPSGPPPPPAPPTFAVPPSPQPAFAPAALVPPPHDDNRPGRRTPIVLLAVAAVFAALIGAGGAVLLFSGDDDSPSDTSAEDRADDVDATTEAGSSAPASASPTETETTEPPTFRCWDGGATVTRLAACTPPSGAAGMAWVFPSSTGATCSTESGAQRASEAECAPVVGDDTVRFHYSEWRSRAALETYYGGNTVAGIAAPGGRDDLTALQVVSRDSSVGYKVAIYYTDPTALWSVTIYAADEAEYLAAIDQLVMRPFRQLRGERA